MSSSTVSILLSIVDTSRNIRSRLRGAGCRAAASSQPPRPSVPSQLVFPYPHDIVASVRKSIPFQPLQSRIVAVVDKWYQSTRRTLQDEYAKTLAHLAEITHLPDNTADRELHTVYERLFRDKLTPKFRMDIDTMLEQVRQRLDASDIHKKGKAPFKIDCLPLLETYFEYNAYPSAQDRALLARKTTMCPRQIEVWFQNHRTRARKEGRQLRRLSQNPLPHQLVLTTPNETVGELLIPKEETKPQNLKSPSPAPPDIITPPPPSPKSPAAKILSMVPPAHAFPTKYRSGAVSYLLGCNTWSFPPPAWPRQASCTPLARTPVVNITPDELAAQLQKLSLSGAVGSKRPQPLQLSPPAWYPAIIAPPTAPHFALIRQKPTQKSNPSSKAPLVSLSSRRLFARKPSPFSNYERPAPYPQRRAPQNLGLDRNTPSRTPRSPSSSSVSSEDPELRTPSPSPPSEIMLMPKDTSTTSHYPDWDAWLLPT